ncbi:MerR family transcriptional regulator [Streptomyces sioyaensis]|uniref:MerR family transcriptional regulator n=1 Tax=Streptomyces sioyaensis TaxID=67364 RepID=UPI0034051AB5
MPPARTAAACGPPDHRDRSAYDEEHLRRLRLVRALIQVGRMPVSTAREVLAAVEGDSLDQLSRLGVAVEALPHSPEPDESPPRRPSPAHRHRAAPAVRPALQLGARGQLPGLRHARRGHRRTAQPRLRLRHGPSAAYAQQAAQLAVVDLDPVEEFATPAEQVAAAVALTVLHEPVLLSLRRPAEAEESNKRYGSGS